MRRLGVALVAIACLLALASAQAAFGPLGEDKRISFINFAARAAPSVSTGG